MSASGTFAWPRPEFAHEPFLVTASETISHAAAAGAALRLAERRAERRRLVVADASVDCMLAIIACWVRGAMAVVVDARAPASAIDAIAARCGAARCGAARTDDAHRASGQSVATPTEFALESHAVALATSGSTSAPKLAVHRMSSLVANALASNERTPFGPGDRWLLSLSPHHVGGLAVLVRAMAGGGAVRLGRGPGAVNDDLRSDDRITHCSVVATQLRRLLDDPAATARCAAMNAILLGGGPAPAAWRHEAVRRGWPLRATYGLTECASQVTTGVATTSDEADDAGTALAGVALRIADDGEIRVGGPTVFAGYLEGEAVRDPRDADGFLATGDVGRIDERGHLHVLGRKDAMFVSGGENIRPEEIERVLAGVDGVAHACVVPIEDERWQWRPVAFVAGAFDAARLESALAAELPRFKWPDRVFAMPPAQAMRTKPERAVLARLAQSGELAPIWTRPHTAS